MPIGAQLGAFRKSLLQWFRKHRRELPWRGTRDPYRVWISEVMLQQTRVAAAIPYYERFLARFPTVQSLAAARESEVLRLWSGLGYYSRARNLHGAAKQMVSRFASHFPATRDEVLALPGVGRYTAAAVLSIAQGAPLAVLDGNVARVLARLGAMRGDLRAPARWRELQGEAQRILAPRQPGDWNQALMELGATVCTPRQPDCGACPLAGFCNARTRGLTAVIPEKRKKRTPVRIEIAAAIFLDRAGRTLLVNPDGATSRDGAADLASLFSRLWQFPAVAVGRPPKRERSELRAYLRKVLKLSKSARLTLAPLPPIHHTVTFRGITLSPYLLRVAHIPMLPHSKRVPLGDLGRLPVSNATRKLAAAACRTLSIG
jgi:A/G-specific adenine glycosylase